MIPDQCPNYYKALEIYTGYFDSLDNIKFLSYPSSIVITRDHLHVYMNCIGKYISEVDILNLFTALFREDCSSIFRMHA